MGKPLRLDDQECTVIGVMPPGFAVYPNPAQMLWALMPAPKRADQFAVFVTGRLKPGVSLAAAEADCSRCTGNSINTIAGRAGRAADLSAAGRVYMVDGPQSEVKPRRAFSAVTVVR